MSRCMNHSKSLSLSHSLVFTVSRSFLIRNRSSYELKLIVDIVSGVHALHKLNLSHGNLKPENVLIFVRATNLRRMLKRITNSFPFVSVILFRSLLAVSFQPKLPIMAQVLIILKQRRMIWYKLGSLFTWFIIKRNFPRIVQISKKCLHRKFQTKTKTFGTIWLNSVWRHQKLTSPRKKYYNFLKCIKHNCCNKCQ